MVREGKIKIRMTPNTSRPLISVIQSIKKLASRLVHSVTRVEENFVTCVMDEVEEVYNEVIDEVIEVIDEDSVQKCQEKLKN